MSLAHTLTPFKNEPPVDFFDLGQRSLMEAALAEVTRRLGQTYFLIVDGKRLRARQTFRSINPSFPSEVIGILPNADRPLVDHALAVAARAYTSWSRVPREERAQALVRLPEVLRRRK